MIPLTHSQERVYDFVKAHLVLGRTCPSFAEIAKGLNMNAVSNVHHHVVQLEKKGWLERSASGKRGLMLAKPSTCPHCGGDLNKNPVRV